MKSMRSMALATLALAALGTEIPSTDGLNRNVPHTSKKPLTNKQKKARIRSKAAKQARKKQRR